MLDELPVFLMSPPRHDWALRGKANFKSEGAPPVNPDRARQEWAALADAICAAGGEVVVCPPHPRRNLTGMIYTAEAGEYYAGPDGAPRFVLSTMAVEHRQDEGDWIGGFVEGLGFRVECIPTTWEAQGDAIRAQCGRKIIHTFGSGKYRRTDPRAYEEVAHLLSDEHIQIHFRAEPWFHGNTFLNVYHGDRLPPRLLEDGERLPETVLVCPEALVPGELDRIAQFLPHAEIVEIDAEASRAYDTNCLQVGDRVLATSDLSQTARDAFLRLDLEIVTLDLGELFGKGGGAPVCLTNRLWGVDVDAIPAHALWSMAPSIDAHTAV